MKENKLLHKRIERNRLGKEFVKYRKVKASEPYRHLQIDIKYIYVHAIKRNALLCSVIDVFTREILNYIFEFSIRKHDVCNLMESILGEHPEVKMATLRSDNGSQFEANMFKNYMINKGVNQEFTHYATPQENAYIESYHNIISRELCHKYIFDSMDEARKEIAGFINYYNNKRLHSGIGYLSPKQFLQKWELELKTNSAL